MPSSFLADILSSFFPKNEFKVLISGLDATGKTTLLYRLKLGEVLTTMPTIGFNVETVAFNFRKVTFWDVGGCDKIRPLWKHYYPNTDGVVFLIDSTDVGRMSEVREMLHDTMGEDDLRRAVLLLFCNKQDLPGALSPEEIVSLLDLDQLSLRNPSMLIHTLRSSVATGEGISEGFEWFMGALTNKIPADSSLNPAPLGTKAGESAEISASPMERLLKEWLEREDESDEIFLGKLKNYSLESWDHRTHLRIAWLLLTRHGRQKGLPMIFESIKLFIENSAITRGAGKDGRGTTFHETMTYFWAHMVHYAIEAEHYYARGLPTAENDVASVDVSGQGNEFKAFLARNPILSNGGLFLEYYSKELVLLNPASRKQMVLPDKKPLPSLISNVKNPSSGSKPLSAAEGESVLQFVNMTLQPTGAASEEQDDDARDRVVEGSSKTEDQAFIDTFTNNPLSLPSWGHLVKLRVIYLMLQAEGRSSKSVDSIMTAVAGVEKAGKHTTLTYFWIQIVTYYAALVASQAHIQGKPVGDSAKGDGAVHHPFILSFSDFLAQPVCTTLQDALLYETYYSRALIDSAHAEDAFQLPDLKPLPQLPFLRKIV